MTGWPDWLGALASLLALSRRSWVYTVLLAARNPTAGWLNRLLALCSTGPGSDRNALFRSVRDLELLAYELEQACDAVLRGTPTTPIEHFLALLATRFTGSVGACAAWSLFAQAILTGYPSGGVADSNYPRIVQALTAVTRQAAHSNLPNTLVEFCQESKSPGGLAPGDLLFWLRALPQELAHERDHAYVLSDLRGVPGPTALNPEVVLEVEDLADIMIDTFGQNVPQVAIVAGLLLADPWLSILSSLGSWLLPPPQLTNDRLTAARERLIVWRNWAMALGGFPPVFPPSAPVDRYYWLFLEVPPPLWVSPPTAIDAAIACIDRWRPNPGGRPATWAAVTAPEEEPLRAVLGSLYLDEVIGCLIACYRERRSAP